MTSFTWTYANLAQGGPVIDVILTPIAVDIVLEPGRARSVRALIDTGSGCSLIQAGLVDELGLGDGKPVRLHGAATAHSDALEYRVRILFADYDNNEAVQVETSATAAALTGQDLDCVLGRDVLLHADLRYDGPRGRVEITFPCS